MRSIWLVFGCLLLLLVGLRIFGLRPAAEPVSHLAPAAPAAVFVAARSASPSSGAVAGPRDSIVRFALRQLGTPYTWAGTSPLTGFDCSGFISYVFGRFGVATPHATALLIDAGRPVPRAQAQPGDIVVFTGTAEGSTTPGHAGIVISALGDTPLRFVHASSAKRESGVKISQVENSGYERRFMQVRRVLDGSSASPTTIAVARPSASIRPLARPAGSIASLPSAAPTVAVPPTAAIVPARVAPLRLHLRALAVAKASAAKQRHPTKQVAKAAKVTTPKSALAQRKVSKKSTASKTTKAVPKHRPVTHRPISKKR